jgi:formate hydrogenlyase subunit 3/multisubunit Na+/H+ antiporter MnhD subunit
LQTTILPQIVLVPLIVGFVLLFLPNRLRALSRLVTLIVSVLVLLWAVRIFRFGPSVYDWPIAQIGDLNLSLLLKAAPLGSFILLFAAGLGLLITLYSLRAMAEAARQNEYYGALLLTLGGSAGILLADHLLLLLIFWEIVTASLYILITTGGKNSNFAATKSFAMIGASDAAFLLGIAIVWMLSGNVLEISKISLTTTSAMPIIAFLLLMTAAITKAGAMPLHTWLPTSGEHAPASVMALLPAAIDKLLGIYLLVIVVRELFVVKSAALSTVLAVVGSATIIIAVMIAMVQHNLKKLLSYHAVSQVGYMILGIATATPVGIAGGIFHMLNNAIYKCCLFLCGGAVEQQTGTAELEQLGGLGKKMPITFAACLVAALSISGVPPFNGFVSKWMVYQGVIQMPGAAKAATTSNLWPIWLTCAMFGSALTLASFVKVLHSVFLSRLPGDLKAVKEVSLAQTLPMMVLAALCVFFGVFYWVPLKHFIYPGIGLESDTDILGTWNSALAAILLAIGIVAGVLLWLIGGFSQRIRLVPTWTCGEVQPNEQMIVPGTHFYKTVSSMAGLKQLYTGQEKGYFDLYDQFGRLGLVLTGLLRWLHSGVLPMYLTWVTLGMLAIILVFCGIT